MTPQPIAPHEPLPHRKVIREWLTPLSKRITAYPIALLVLDYSLFWPPWPASYCSRQCGQNC